MRFYFKDGGDQLLVRRLNRACPSSTSAHTSTDVNMSGLDKVDEELSEDDPRWKSFLMPLRTPAPVPSPPDLVRFLTSSLTFMARLRSVSILLNGKPMAKVAKFVGAKRDLGVARELELKGIGEGGIIKINAVSETRRFLLMLIKAMYLCLDKV
jgi:hypothetical protein